MTVEARFTLDTAVVADRLRRLQKTIPEVMGRSAFGIALDVKRAATSFTLRGGEMRSRGVINDLRIYCSSIAPVKDEEGVVWGLPTGGSMKSAGPNGPDLPMSRIGAFFEKGGTIRPVNAKMLRIPIPNGPAVTQAGYDRFQGIPLRTTDSQGWHVGKKADGRLFLMRTTAKGKRGTIRDEVWYRLMDSTTVRPHPWFSKAVEAVQGSVEATVAKAFKEAGL